MCGTSILSSKLGDMGGQLTMLAPMAFYPWLDPDTYVKRSCSLTHCMTISIKYYVITICDIEL